MTTIELIDTTIRDGQASLWAMNMTTRHLAATMPYFDEAGFESMEFIATGSRLKKFVRHLHENPWDWIVSGARAAKHTPLRWHGLMAGSTMSGYVPLSIGKLLVEKAVELGITLNRLGSNWNDYAVVKDEQDRFNECGMRSVVNVIYSVSPRHTDDYFVQKAREAAAIDPWRLCLKDVGGLLTPDRVRELVPKLMAVTPGITWEFHGHCNNSFGPVNAIECAKLGISHIHSALPPLANANSQPSVYGLAANLRALGYEVPVREEVLRPATEYLTYVARREGYQIGVPYEYDERLYRHQVPGGMISNLQFQLSQAGLSGRLAEVLEEIPRVRAELGYPIMVTPLSQIVGTQAAVNVIVGDRYRQVTDETIEYALGRHGREAPLVMDQSVRDRILDRPRARELDAQVPEEPSLAELRERYGTHISDEELILRVVVGDDALDDLRPSPTSLRGPSQHRPILELVSALVNDDRHRFVSLSGTGYSVTIRKSS